MTPTYIGFVYNAQHPTALQMTEAVMRSLDLGEDCWLSAAENLDDIRPLLNDTRLIVIAGGDGTILRVVRSIAEFGVPLVGINMGRVGFMAELQVHEVMEELPAYLNGGARMEERMMLEVSVTHGDEQEPYLTLHALNDVVVGRGGSARLLDIVATIDGVILTNYRADAVIVSTATGSTGYALSAGGPIMYPETKAMLIQPVAAHTGLRSGLILPDYTELELQASDKHEALLSVDGFKDTLLHGDDRVSIRRSQYVTRFLRRHAPTAFYAALTRRTLGMDTPTYNPPDNT
jgi:NAD+ kinase